MSQELLEQNYFTKPYDFGVKDWTIVRALKQMSLRPFLEDYGTKEGLKKTYDNFKGFASNPTNIVGFGSTGAVGNKADDVFRALKNTKDFKVYGNYFKNGDLLPDLQELKSIIKFKRNPVTSKPKSFNPNYIPSFDGIEKAEPFFGNQRYLDELKRMGQGEYFGTNALEELTEDFPRGTSLNMNLYDTFKTYKKIPSQGPIGNFAKKLNSQKGRPLLDNYLNQIESQAGGAMNGFMEKGDMIQDAFLRMIERESQLPAKIASRGKVLKKMLPEVSKLPRDRAMKILQKVLKEEGLLQKDLRPILSPEKYFPYSLRSANMDAVKMKEKEILDYMQGLLPESPGEYLKGLGMTIKE